MGADPFSAKTGVSLLRVSDVAPTLAEVNQETVSEPVIPRRIPFLRLSAGRKFPVQAYNEFQACKFWFGTVR